MEALWSAAGSLDADSYHPVPPANQVSLHSLQLERVRQRRTMIESMVASGGPSSYSLNVLKSKHQKQEAHAIQRNQALKQQLLELKHQSARQRASVDSVVKHAEFKVAKHSYLATAAQDQALYLKQHLTRMYTERLQANKLVQEREAVIIARANQLAQQQAQALATQSEMATHIITPTAPQPQLNTLLRSNNPTTQPQLPTAPHAPPTPGPAAQPPQPPTTIPAAGLPFSSASPPTSTSVPSGWQHVTLGDGRTAWLIPDDAFGMPASMATSATMPPQFINATANNMAAAMQAAQMMAALPMAQMMAASAAFMHPPGMHPYSSTAYPGMMAPWPQGPPYPYMGSPGSPPHPAGHPWMPPGAWPQVPGSFHPGSHVQPMSPTRAHDTEGALQVHSDSGGGPASTRPTSNRSYEDLPLHSSPSSSAPPLPHPLSPDSPLTTATTTSLHRRSGSGVSPPIRSPFSRQSSGGAHTLTGPASSRLSTFTAALTTLHTGSSGGSHPDSTTTSSAAGAAPDATGAAPDTDTPGSPHSEVSMAGGLLGMYQLAGGSIDGWEEPHGSPDLARAASGTGLASPPSPVALNRPPSLIALSGQPSLTHAHSQGGPPSPSGHHVWPAALTTAMKLRVADDDAISIGSSIAHQGPSSHIHPLPDSTSSTSQPSSTPTSAVPTSAVPSSQSIQDATKDDLPTTSAAPEPQPTSTSTLSTTNLPTTKTTVMPPPPLEILTQSDSLPQEETVFSSPTSDSAYPTTPVAESPSGVSTPGTSPSRSVPQMERSETPRDVLGQSLASMNTADDDYDRPSYPARHAAMTQDVLASSGHVKLGAGSVGHVPAVSHRYSDNDGDVLNLTADSESSVGPSMVQIAASFKTGIEPPPPITVTFQSGVDTNVTAPPESEAGSHASLIGNSITANLRHLALSQPSNVLYPLDSSALLALPDGLSERIVSEFGHAISSANNSQEGNAQAHAGNAMSPLGRRAHNSRLPHPSEGLMVLSHLTGSGRYDSEGHAISRKVSSLQLHMDTLDEEGVEGEMDMAMVTTSAVSFSSKPSDSSGPAAAAAVSAPSKHGGSFAALAGDALARQLELGASRMNQARSMASHSAGGGGSGGDKPAVLLSNLMVDLGDTSGVHSPGSNAMSPNSTATSVSPGNKSVPKRISPEIRGSDSAGWDTPGTLDVSNPRPQPTWPSTSSKGTSNNGGAPPSGSDNASTRHVTIAPMPFSSSARIPSATNASESFSLQVNRSQSHKETVNSQKDDRSSAGSFGGKSFTGGAGPGSVTLQTSRSVGMRQIMSKVLKEKSEFDSSESDDDVSERMSPALSSSIPINRDASLNMRVRATAEMSRVTAVASATPIVVAAPLNAATNTAARVPQGSSGSFISGLVSKVNKAWRVNSMPLGASNNGLGTFTASGPSASAASVGTGKGIDLSPSKSMPIRPTASTKGNLSTTMSSEFDVDF